MIGVNRRRVMGGKVFKNYLAFTAIDDCTFQLSTNSVNYSLNGGKTWVELPAETASPTVLAGETIMWSANLTPAGSTGIGTFSSTGAFNISGNILSLLYGKRAERATSMPEYAFVRLFKDTTAVDASMLELPDFVSIACYRSLFEGSTITFAPALNAMELAEYCYETAFKNCKSLMATPILPATIMKRNCYASMFDGCSSLVTVTTLPSTSLAISCYDFMLARTAITSAPILPATTLVQTCYRGLFQECKNLQYIKAMFTTNPGTSTINWVLRVAGTGTFVKNSAATWETEGISGVPSGWTIEYADE